MRASDCTLNLTSTTTACAFRIDGELRDRVSPIAIKDKLASRIKVISRLDISEKGCRKTVG